MNNLLQTFCTYLVNVGIIDDDAVLYIQQLFNEIQLTKQQNIYNQHFNGSNSSNNSNSLFKETMLATLIYYLSSLNEETKEKISFALLMKFFNNDNNNNINPQYNKLKSCILLCNAKHNCLLALLKVNKFNSWKHKTLSHHHNKPSLTRNKTSSSFRNRHMHRRSYNGGSNNNSNYSYKQLQQFHNFTSTSQDKQCPKYKGLRIETSVDRKEKEDLIECTFHPDTTLSNSYHRRITSNNINDTNTVGNNNNNNESVYDRLYRDREKYESKRQMKKIEFEHKLSQQYVFKPALLSTPNKFRNKSEFNFNERQLSFINQKTQNKQKIQHLIDEDYNTKCSFSPKINKSISSYHSKTNNNNNSNGNNNNSFTNKNLLSQRTYSSPAHIRLYEHNKHRRTKSNQINQQQQITHNQYTKISSTEHNNNSNSNCNCNSNSNAINARKIEELYKQYKKRPSKIQHLRNAIDNENGITFEPYVNRNNKYYAKINSNVLERSEQLIQHKKDFVKAVNDAQDKYWKENKYGYRYYTPGEKEEITQRIIQRLYGKGYAQTNSNDNIERKEYEFGTESEDELQRHVYNEHKRNDNNNEIQNDYFNNDKDYRNYNDKIISIDDYTYGKNRKHYYT